MKSPLLSPWGHSFILPFSLPEATRFLQDSIFMEKWTSTQFETPFVFKEFLYCTIFSPERTFLKLEVELGKMQSSHYYLAVACSISLPYSSFFYVIGWMPNLFLWNELCIVFNDVFTMLKLQWLFKLTNNGILTVINLET